MAGRALSLPPTTLPSLRKLTISRAPLWRIHRSSIDPVTFARDDHGRFNLASPRGTLYTALDPLGAFIEVFGRFAILDASEVAAFRMTELSVTTRDVADLTHRSVLGSAGHTAEIHSTPDYSLTRAWAQAIAAEGYAGILYLARHDPAGSLTSIALFDHDVLGPPSALATEPISSALIDRAGTEFGLLAAPRRLPRR